MALYLPHIFSVVFPPLAALFSHQARLGDVHGAAPGLPARCVQRGGLEVKRDGLGLPRSCSRCIPLIPG